MTDQMALDFNPPAQRHSETSTAAAEAIKPTAGSMRAKVLDLLTAVGPQTDEEIQRLLGMNPSTERPRRIELVAAGLVHDTGQRAPTSSGRSAVLWGAAC